MILALRLGRTGEILAAQEGIALAVTSLIFIYFSVLLPAFLTPGNLISLVRSVAVLGMQNMPLGSVFFQTLGQGYVFGIPNAILMFLLLALIIHLFLSQARLEWIAGADARVGICGSAGEGYRKPAQMRKQADRLGYTFEIRDPAWSTEAGTRALQGLISEAPDLLVVHNPDIQS